MVQLTPTAPAAREKANVTVEITGPTGEVVELDAIGGTDVHLVAASRDLSWYEHQHPRRDGAAWVAAIAFPSSGEYVLHTIFRPTNQNQVVEKQVVRVGGTPPRTPRTLDVSRRELRSGRYAVQLTTTPDPPAAGVWSSLVFSIARDGKPVTNLVPTGTLGHIVILREGGEEFVYAHSTDGEATGGIRGRAHVRATPSESAANHSRHVGDTGPEVTFHTRFAKTGRYRMWVDFRDGDESIDADFAVEVGQPTRPEHKD